MAPIPELIEGSAKLFELYEKDKKHFFRITSLYFIVYIVILVAYLFSPAILGESITDTRTLLAIAGSVFGVALVFFLIKWCWSEIQIVNHSANFSLSDDEDVAMRSWLVQGSIDFDPSEKAILITDSDAGCVIKDRAWKNMKATFQAKCFNENGFGIIFRAQTLDHYLMIKINPKHPPVFHFRYKWGWQILKGTGDPVTLVPNQWQNFSFSVNGQSLVIQIDKYIWQHWIGHFGIINAVLFGMNPPRMNNKLDDNNQDQGGSLVLPMNDLRYGNFGFRAWGPEKVAIRKLLVRQVQ